MCNQRKINDKNNRFAAVVFPFSIVFPVNRSGWKAQSFSHRSLSSQRGRHSASSDAYCLAAIHANGRIAAAATSLGFHSPEESLTH